MFRVVFTTLAIIGALFQIFVNKTPPVEAFLFNFILFNIGFYGILAFMGYYFRSDVVAVKIVWQPGGPLQKVVAFSNLSRGILGILCIWFRGDFWSLTVIVSSIFIFSCGLGHVKEMVVNKNEQPYNIDYNTDFVLSFDLLFPVALIALLVVYKMGM